MANTCIFPKKTIRDINVCGKRILLRAEFNVPMTEAGEILSDYRITESIPTLRYLLERNCSIVVLSKVGRPKGVVDKKFCLAPVVKQLASLLPEYSVKFQPSTTDDAALQACKRLQNKQLLVLENIRFDPREAENSLEFARLLRSVSKADYFVEDAFGMVHREETSTSAITQLLPSVAGLLVEKEYCALKNVMQHPSRPLVAIVGGAKISDKIGFIEALLRVADTILIGGAMANTFLQYQKLDVGKSLVEPGQEEEIEKIFHNAKPGQIILPSDVAVAKKIAKNVDKKIVNTEDVASDDIILDIGPETIKSFSEVVTNAETVLWNGTLGYAELKQFAVGSEAVAKAVSNGTKISVIGGGDTADFALDYLSEHKESSFYQISTGGGASLELLSGTDLPGVTALLDR